MARKTNQARRAKELRDMKAARRQDAARLSRLLVLLPMAEGRARNALTRDISSLHNRLSSAI